jgi:hypothetical protein
VRDRRRARGARTGGFSGRTGTNKNLKRTTIASAWVDRDMILDIASFQRFQPKIADASAKVLVVRGWYGNAYNRDFYCNGIPLAHLPTKHMLDFDVQPGW